MNETMAQCFAAKHSTWVHYLLHELDQPPTTLIDLHGDNDQATQLGQEPMMTTANKYYWPQHYYTKEVHGVTVNCERVPTEDNDSDLLTKAVDLPTLRKLLPRLTGHIGPFGSDSNFDLSTTDYIQV